MDLDAVVEVTLGHPACSLLQVADRMEQPAIEKMQRGGRQQRQERRHRPFDEDAQTLCDPEDPRQVAGNRLFTARGQIDLRQRPLRGHATGKQHRIGLGVAALESGGEDRSHHQAGGKAGIGAEEFRARPAYADDRESNA